MPMTLMMSMPCGGGMAPPPSMMSNDIWLGYLIMSPTTCAPTAPALHQAHPGRQALEG